MSQPSKRVHPETRIPLRDTRQEVSRSVAIWFWRQPFWLFSSYWAGGCFSSLLRKTSHRALAPIPWLVTWPGWWGNRFTLPWLTSQRNMGNSSRCIYQVVSGASWSVPLVWPVRLYCPRRTISPADPAHSSVIISPEKPRISSLRTCRQLWSCSGNSPILHCARMEVDSSTWRER